MAEQKSYNENPISENFCTSLEYLLCETFQKSDRPDLKGFWCDGVSWDSIPDRQLTKNSINDTQKIITKAWIGKNGQDEYEMTIQFGKYALKLFAEGTEIIECIPSTESMDWIDINIEKKKIKLRLK